MAKLVTLGEMNYTIEVMRRDLLPVMPGQSAEPRHAYTERKLLTKSKVTTLGGTSEIAKVEINGKRATHSFQFRCPSTDITIDVRDRVRDTRGQLYQILSVENIDMLDKQMILHCSNQGLETVEAAR